MKASTTLKFLLPFCILIASPAALSQEGADDAADLMTKYLTREKIDAAIYKMSQVRQAGRAKSTLDIQGKVYAISGRTARESATQVSRLSCGDGSSRAPSSKGRWA